MTKLFLFCGALAAGEYLASFAPNLSETWPVAACVGALVALFGYGCAVRGWRVAVVFFLGIALYQLAATSGERAIREQPWLRGRERYQRRSAAEECETRAHVKRDFSRRVVIGLEEEREAVPLLRAILLGERTRLPRRTKQLFVTSGTMHVFAISGLHVMAIAEVLSFALCLLFVPRRFGGLLATPLLWGYVWLIGFSPSAVRAAVMATILFLAPVGWRKPNGLRAWALTFLGVHAVNPLLIDDVGNALSFAVMLAIVLAGECGRNLTKVGQSLLVTVAAWAVGVPIAAHVFGRVTPGGMLANLVLIGAAKLAVVAGAMGLFASYVSETFAAHLNNFGALAIRGMVLVAEGVTWIPGANFETGKWSLPACVGWYAALAAVAYLILRLRASRKTL